MPHEDDAERLEQAVCRADCFTPEERDELLEIIRLMRGWRFTVRVAKGGTVILAIIAATLASWSTVTEALRKWLN